MIRRTRPDAPPSYYNPIRDTRIKKIQEWLDLPASSEKNYRPSTQKRKPLDVKPRYEDAEDAYGFITELSACFDNKCPFCESTLDLGRAEVFLYRPLAVEHGSNDKAEHHYCWLMWEWSNLYPACESCALKRGRRFPVAKRRATIGVYTEQVLKKEKPYLLDPCDDYPDEHLEFHEDGRVTAKSGSGRGEKTIEVLGLNREGLQAKRKEEVLVLRKAWEEKLRAAVDPLKEVGEIFRAVYQENCRDDQPFAGMKRQLLNRWSEDASKKPIAHLPPGEPPTEPHPPNKSNKVTPPPDPPPLRIFLCHASSDKPRVRKLYDQLVADGFDVWLDEKKLVPGQDWDLEIRKAVSKSDAVVVCLSNGSITKDGYVQKEIRIALDVADRKPEGSIFIIPTRLEECNVPYRLSKWHWVDYFEGAGEEAGYKHLLQALRKPAAGSDQ